MTTFTVRHETIYTYGSPISSSYGEACLLPRETDQQVCQSATVTVDPPPAEATEREDHFGNRVVYFTVQDGHTRLTIFAESTLDVIDPMPQNSGAATMTLADVKAGIAAVEGPEGLEGAEFLLDSQRTPQSPRTAEYAAPSFSDERPFLDCLTDLAHRINTDFAFQPDSTDVNSAIDDLFDEGGGVCQDFAHLMVACLRGQGIPARYVSGYLETQPPPGQPKMVGSDVSHAWVSALVPGVGWVDVDPTNDQLVDDRYVTVGWGRDYDDVAPLKGVVFSDGGETTLEVSVDVRRH